MSKVRLFGKWAVVYFIGVAFAFTASVALAHPGGHVDEEQAAKFTVSKKMKDALIFLEWVTEHQVRKSNWITNVEAEIVGALLIGAVQAELMLEVDTRLPPSKQQWAVKKIGNFFKRLNPLSLGKWLITNAKKVGATKAITVASVEAAEQASVFYGLRTGNVWLTTFGLSHGGDLIQAGIIAGPKAKDKVKSWMDTVKKWARFGGPYGLYLEYMKQRALIPLDWDRIIDAGELEVNAYGASKTVPYVVMPGSWVPKLMPRFIVKGVRKVVPEKIRVWLTPEWLKLPSWVQKWTSARAQAQRDTAVNFTVRELEIFVEDIEPKVVSVDQDWWFEWQRGTYLKELKKYKKRFPRLYVRLLQSLILTGVDPDVTRRFQMEVEKRSAEYDLDWKLVSQHDVADILNARDAFELRQIGDAPNAIAQKLAWYFKDRIELMRKWGTLQPKKVPKRAKKALREIEKRINNSKNGLASLKDVNTLEEGEALAYEKVFALMWEINGRIYHLEMDPELPYLEMTKDYGYPEFRADCKRLLLGK